MSTNVRPVSAGKASWFPFSFSRKPTPPEPAQICIELIGRENSGKTVLLDMIARVLMQIALPSGLQFSHGDPRHVAASIRQIREKLRLVRSDGMPTTLESSVRRRK